MMHPMIMAAFGARKGLRLNAGDGGNIVAVDAVAPYNTTVAIRFNPDGTVEKGTSTDGAAIVWTGIGTWIDPVHAASGDYSVRYTNLVSVGGRDFTTKAAVEDTFIAITTARVWLWNETAFMTSNNLFDCDFEVQDDVGSAITGSSSYAFTVANSA